MGVSSGFVHACIASRPCVQQYISSVLDICYVDTSLTWFSLAFLRITTKIGFMSQKIV